MSEVWPSDTKQKNPIANADGIRQFRCLMLMPYESRFDLVAKILEEVTTEIFKRFPNNGLIVERMDWVTSANVIHSEIWQKILEADLIFCDITGYNPNVMFELGVAAGWKNKDKVVLLKDRYWKAPPAFDLLPARYIEYKILGTQYLIRWAPV